MNVAGQSYFLIGVGGMGMAPLALYLRGGGARVRGWDDGLRPALRHLLESAGVELSTTPELPAGVDTVVFSSAVRRSHPIRLQASERGLPELRRGELLARLSTSRKLVAVCGSHGKTTTTGMLITALRRAGHPVGYVLGGLFGDAALAPAAYSEHPWLVAEVDESDGTIEGFSPEITVCVNLDWDHPDHYRTPTELESAFRRLFLRTQGTILLPAHEPGLARLVDDRTPARLLTFGAVGDFSATATLRGPRSLTLHLNGRFGEQPPPAEVAAGGHFNAMNATAALAATALIAGETPPPTVLAGFSGIRRRQTVLHQTAELTVFEDYAHHPAEIAPLLRFAREAHPGRRVVCVFQPHRYTRTAQYRTGFAEALSGAEGCALLETYAACEDPLPGGTAADIAACFADHQQPTILREPAALDQWLGRQLDVPAVLLFIGAGDIDRWAAHWLERRAQRAASGQWLDELRPALSADCLVREHEPLAEKTTWRLGGAARWYAEPTTVNDLRRLLGAARAAGVPTFLLGRGSNLLVADGGYAGLIVRLHHPLWEEVTPLEGGRLRVGAGVRLKQLCAEAAKRGLAGWEFLEGIPGVVGGSLRMNAGAMGGWIFDVVESVTLLRADGTVAEVPRTALRPGYRQCPELREAIALSAIFKAPGEGSEAEIRTRMETLSCKRKASQPREPSAGCVFKNPANGHAGKLIDETGLKGLRVGRIEVSPIHANFFVNHGGGTANDVLALIRLVRQRVFERTGIVLEPEVLPLGLAWDDVLPVPTAPTQAEPLPTEALVT